jgi:hypothetical protein
MIRVCSVNDRSRSSLRHNKRLSGRVRRLVKTPVLAAFFSLLQNRDPTDSSETRFGSGSHAPAAMIMAQLFPETIVRSTDLTRRLVKTMYCQEY